MKLALELEGAMQVLREDDEFQAEMRDPAVRIAVDEVRDDPNNVIKHSGNARAMACLQRLRKLQAFCKHRGKSVSFEQFVLEPGSRTAHEHREEIATYTQQKDKLLRSVVEVTLKEAGVEPPPADTKKKPEPSKGSSSAAAAAAAADQQKAKAKGSDYSELVKKLDEQDEKRRAEEAKADAAQAEAHAALGDVSIARMLTEAWPALKARLAGQLLLAAAVLAALYAVHVFDLNPFELVEDPTAAGDANNDATNANAAPEPEPETAPGDEFEF